MLLLTAPVIPRIELSPYPQQLGTLGPMLTIQHAPPGSSGLLGQAATVAWVLLMTAGAAALIGGRGLESFRIALGVMILEQLGIHLIYGEETFLYALNYVPLLVLAASLATRSRWRPLVLACAVVFIPCAAWNNVSPARESPGPAADSHPVARSELAALLAALGDRDRRSGRDDGRRKAVNRVG